MMNYTRRNAGLVVGFYSAIKLMFDIDSEQVVYIFNYLQFGMGITFQLINRIGLGICYCITARNQSPERWGN